LNKIIRMALRLIMGKLLTKGLNAGLKNAASQSGGDKPARQRPLGDPGTSAQTREEVRAARRAGRTGDETKQSGHISMGKSRRQTKQAVRMLRRSGNL